MQPDWVSYKALMTNWEADTLKRDLNQANRDKDELEQKVQRLQRDNASLKKLKVT